MNLVVTKELYKADIITHGTVIILRASHINKQVSDIMQPFYLQENTLHSVAQRGLPADVKDKGKGLSLIHI